MIKYCFTSWIFTYPNTIVTIKGLRVSFPVVNSGIFQTNEVCASLITNKLHMLVGIWFIRARWYGKKIGCNVKMYFGMQKKVEYMLIWGQNSLILVPGSQTLDISIYHCCFLTDDGIGMKLWSLGRDTFEDWQKLHRNRQWAIVDLKTTHHQTLLALKVIWKPIKLSTHQDFLLGHTRQWLTCLKRCSYLLSQIHKIPHRHCQHCW